MKALVYIVCVAVAAMVQTAISMSGVQLGGLPVVLLYGTALAVAALGVCVLSPCKERPGEKARTGHTEGTMVHLPEVWAARPGGKAV